MKTSFGSGYTILIVMISAFITMLSCCICWPLSAQYNVGGLSNGVKAIFLVISPFFVMIACTFVCVNLENKIASVWFRKNIRASKFNEFIKEVRQ
ncbi:hypothetical protein [Erwinia phage FBB1]|nr:hypothetical protein [Erwinia phage FBB1]